MATTSIIHGKAQVQGIIGTFDAILYATQQSGNLTQQWDGEVIKNEDGKSVSWKAQDENLDGDLKMKLIGDTLAHALAPAQSVAYSAGAAGSAVSSLGQPFLAPLSCINFTIPTTTPVNPTIAAFAGTYQYQSGASVSMSNTGVAELDVKVKRYADSTTNTLANTVPA